MNKTTAALFALLAIAALQPCQASETVVGIALKAHHFQGNYWAPMNPGLTIEYRADTRGPAQVATGAGVIRDSLGNWSPFTSAGLVFPVGEDFRVGVRAVLLYRQWNLDGEKPGLIVAPLPSIEYWRENVGVGVVYIPRPSDAPKDSAAALVSLQVRF